MPCLACSWYSGDVSRAAGEWGGKVTVCGSTNNDLIVSGPRLPLAGETIAHDTFAQCFGGKGANQAVQAFPSRAASSRIVC